MRACMKSHSLKTRRSVCACVCVCLFVGRKMETLYPYYNKDVEESLISFFLIIPFR